MNMAAVLAKSVALLGLMVAAVAVDRQFDVVTQAKTFVRGLMPGATATAGDQKPAAAALRQVRVVTPKAAPSQFSLTLPGRTAAIEQARISGRATGVVSEWRGEIGDRVKRGDILVVIDAPEISQQLLRAKAAVEQVKARLELAEVTLGRAEELVPKKFLPEQTRDDRAANVSIARADLAAAEAEVRRLEEIERFQTIRAPFDGIIIERQVERGDRVTGDFGATGTYFYNVARLEQLRIEIDVPQSSALKVKPGTEAKITFAEMHQRTFEARVVRTTQAIDAASGTMRAELVMDNPGLLLPAGLNGQVELSVEREEGCVLVPGNVLVLRQGQQHVAVANGEDVIEFRPVVLSRELGMEAEVCSGISIADRVILSPNALLKDGDKVEIVKPVS